MLEIKDSLVSFVGKVNCVFDDFKKLSYSDQCQALQVLEGCFKEMQKIIEINKISSSDNSQSIGEDSIELKPSNETNIKEDLLNKSPLKYDLVNQLNILNGNDLNLQQPIQADYSDSDKEESNGFSDSSCLMFRRHLNSLVERLEIDENFLNSDNAVESFSNNVKSNNNDKIISNHKFKIGKIDTNDNNNIVSDDKSSNVSNSDTDIIKKCEDAKKKQSFNKFSCILCRKQFDTYTKLVEHISSHSGTSQSCIKCKTTFVNVISYKYHLMNSLCSQNKILNKCKRTSIQKILLCPYCGESFGSTFNLRRHLQRKCGQNIKEYLNDVSNAPSDNYLCEICNIRFNMKDIYEEHKLKHEKHRCNKCGANFSCRRLLRNHRVTEHKKAIAEFNCKACNIEFPNRALYRVHMKNNKNDEKHIKIKKADNSEIVWCKTCMMSFISKRTYNKHCLSISHLKNSNQVILNLKKFMCEKCGLEFVTKDMMKVHYNRSHKNNNLYKCDNCTYTTSTSYNLARHKGVCNKKLVKTIACDKCPILFDSLSKLKQHIKCVHCDERPFSCDICDKKFKLNSQLNKHKIIHNPECPFTCSYCSNSFRRRTNLQRHILCKHEEHVKSNDLGGKNVKDSTKGKEVKQIVNANEQETVDMQNQDVISLIDVQSGELVILSIKEINKNSMNITADGELINTVHIPELWNSQTGEIYPMDSEIQSEQTMYMVPVDRLQETQYVTNYIQIPNNDKNDENIELLTGDMLSEVTLGNDMIATSDGYNLNNMELQNEFVNK